MFASIEVSPERGRNGRLLQEIRADRAGRHPRRRKFASPFYVRRQGGLGVGD